MKNLIAIPSCPSLEYWHKTIETTWGNSLAPGTSLKFFFGSELGTGDDLQSLTHKVVSMFKWSLEHEYDFVFKCDLDTFVIPKNLLSSGFEKHNWVGGQNGFFASGGAGYWLSKEAMRVVVRHPTEEGQAEDVNTAHALLEKNFSLHPDFRYKFIPEETTDPTMISYHLSSVKGWAAKSSPQELQQVYDDFNKGIYKPYIVKPEPRWKGRLRRT